MGQACLIWGSFYGLSIKEGPFAIEYLGPWTIEAHHVVRLRSEQYLSHLRPRLRSQMPHSKSKVGGLKP